MTKISIAPVHTFSPLPYPALTPNRAGWQPEQNMEREGLPQCRPERKREETAGANNFPPPWGAALKTLMPGL